MDSVPGAAETLEENEDEEGEEERGKREEEEDQCHHVHTVVEFNIF